MLRIPHSPLRVHTRYIDLAATRRYVHAVAWLAAYGAATRDPRELLAVVRVLTEDPPRTLRRLMERAA